MQPILYVWNAYAWLSSFQVFVVLIFFQNRFVQIKKCVAMALIYSVSSIYLLVNRKNWINNEYGDTYYYNCYNFGVDKTWFKNKSAQTNKLQK